MLIKLYTKAQITVEVVNEPLAHRYNVDLYYSLVPRPSHHPVFDHLPYAKMKGEGPFYHMNDISVYLSRQMGGGVPRRKNELEA